MKNIIGFILIGAIAFGLYVFYAKQEAKERERKEAQEEIERIRVYQKEQAAEARAVTKRMIISHSMKYTQQMEAVYVGEIKNIYSKTITNIVFGFANDNTDDIPRVYYNRAYYDSKHNLLVNIRPNQTEFVQFPLNYNISHLKDINKAMIVTVRFEDGSIETGDGYKGIQ